VTIKICRAARKQCDSQFLDQTVSLRQLRMRRTGAGLQMVCVYGFDSGAVGIGRHTRPATND